MHRILQKYLAQFIKGELWEFIPIAPGIALEILANSIRLAIFERLAGDASERDGSMTEPEQRDLATLRLVCWDGRT